MYVAAPLNTHRRHKGGMTHRLTPEVHLEDITRMHECAAEALELNAAARAAQARYRAGLRERFSQASGSGAF